MMIHHVIFAVAFYNEMYKQRHNAHTHKCTNSFLMEVKDESQQDAVLKDGQRDSYTVFHWNFTFYGKSVQ